MPLEGVCGGWRVEHPLLEQSERSLMVMLLEQMDDFAFADPEVLYLCKGIGMVRKEIELGGLVPEEVDVPDIDVVIEPLLGDCKLLSDFCDGEIACWPTWMRMGALLEDPLVEANAPDGTLEHAVTAG
jgi:hypothetical protein